MARGERHLVENATTAKAPRGRPRDEARHGAVLAATRELLAEGGYHAASISEIAVRAGVTRQLIYRWWPTLPALVAEAIFSDAPQQRASSVEGPLSDDVRRFVAGLVHFVSRPAVRAGIVGLMSAGEEARGLPRLEAEAFQAVEDRLRAIVVAAEQRGQARSGIDVRLLVSTLRGAIVLHIVGDRTPPDQLIDHLTEVCVAVFHGD